MTTVGLPYTYRSVGRMASCKFGLVAIIIIIGLVGADNPADMFVNSLQTLMIQNFGDFDQSYFDQLQFTKGSVDGNQIVASLAKVVNNRATSHLAALGRVRDELVRMYDNVTDNVYVPCCNITGGFMSMAFKTVIDFMKMCILGPGIPPPYTYPVNNNVLQVMQSNLGSMPTMRHQLFTTTDHNTFMYPATSVCTPPQSLTVGTAYISTLVNSRDVVIVIDNSAVMGVNYTVVNGQNVSYFDTARNAAIVVLNGLSQNDRVGVVTVANDVTLPSTAACYSTRLAAATVANVASLQAFLQGQVVVPKSKALHEKGFDAAFRLFNASKLDDTGYNNALRVKVILFVTAGSGSYNTNNIYKTIYNWNNNMSNQVVVMTYGMGNLNAADRSVLQAIALQKFNILPVATNPPQPGQFQAINTTVDFGLVMGTYFNLFVKPDPTRILPFEVLGRSTSGSGMEAVACLPVVYNQVLKGVTCTEMVNDEMFNEIRDVSLGTKSYAFVVDDRGRLFMHPLLPLAATITTDPIYVPLESVETNKAIGDIKKSMMSGQTGTRTVLNTQLVVPRGDTSMQGVGVSIANVTYYWTPIPVLNYSVCVVLVDGEQDPTVKWTGTYNDFLWDEDMHVTDPTMCVNTNRLVYTSASVVKLAPKCFMEPAVYTNIPMSPQTMTDLKTYLRNMGPAPFPSFQVQPGVREIIAATDKLQSIWINRDHAIYSDIILTYIATKEGVYRGYPATRTARNYDVSVRNWYSAPAENRGSLTVTIPYMDESGAGVIVTIGKALLSGSAPHTSKDIVGAVLAFDMKLTSLNRLLRQVFYPCANAGVSCFVVDNNGFVLIHDSFLVDENAAASAQHMTVLEPAVAWLMAKDGVLLGDSCFNLYSATNQVFWKVAIPANEMGVHTQNSNYQLYQVNESNIFIVVKNNPTVNTRCGCNTTNVMPDGSQQCSYRNPLCECLCSTITNKFDNCLNRFTFASTDTWKACYPSVMPLGIADDLASEQPYFSIRPSCFCDVINDADECTSKNCIWSNNACSAAAVPPIQPTSPTIPGACDQTAIDEQVKALSDKFDSILLKLQE